MANGYWFATVCRLEVRIENTNDTTDTCTSWTIRSQNIIAYSMRWYVRCPLSYRQIRVAIDKMVWVLRDTHFSAQPRPQLTHKHKYTRIGDRMPAKIKWWNGLGKHPLPHRANHIMENRFFSLVFLKNNKNEMNEERRTMTKRNTCVCVCE